MPIMRNKLTRSTLYEIGELLGTQKIPWILTRYGYGEVSDLDVLVKSKDFNKVILIFRKAGYEVLSHNHALGGRKTDFQFNLLKKGRIKIDLHKNFTWRKSEYMDSDLIWSGIRQASIDGVLVYRPSVEVDCFLNFVNILFEKTYLLGDEKVLLQHIDVLNKSKFVNQAKKYKWSGSLLRFYKWLNTLNNNDYPIFAPVSIIIYSYIEKLFRAGQIDLISLAYYTFFRTRYVLTRKLPY